MLLKVKIEFDADDTLVGKVIWGDERERNRLLQSQTAIRVIRQMVQDVVASVEDVIADRRHPAGPELGTPTQGS